MRAIAEEVGGEYHDNALWWANRVITVHPLGGAVMGRHAGEGVCDAYGEVFGHPGLYVLDGALLPGPVGANPSLTIAAVADRAATRMVDTAVVPTAASRPAPAGSTDGAPPSARIPGPHASGLRFTERMRGFAALGATDPLLGYEAGRRSGGALMFELTISVDDVDRFIADPGHEGAAAGYVESDLLGGRFEVLRGWFNLFSPGPDLAERRMLYRLWLTGPGGNPLTFSGEKRVEDDRGLDVWRDTSTLYVRILQGHLAPGEPDTMAIASGIITIHVPDFIKQLTTFRCWGERPFHALDEFGRLFLGELYDVYGRLIARQEEPRP
jgi:cholesterol oxidase